MATLMSSSGKAAHCPGTVHVDRPGRKLSKAKSSTADEVHVVELPSHVGTGTTRWRVWRHHKKEGIWVHKEDVPQALEAVRKDYMNKGVEEVVTGSVDDADDDNLRGGSLTWDSRDGAWLGRVRGAHSGQIYRTTKCVPKFHPHTKVRVDADTFLEKKEEIRRSLLALLEEHRAL